MLHSRKEHRDHYEIVAGIDASTVESVIRTGKYPTVPLVLYRRGMLSEREFVVHSCSGSSYQRKSVAAGSTPTSTTVVRFVFIGTIDDEPVKIIYHPGTGSQPPAFSTVL